MKTTATLCLLVILLVILAVGCTKSDIAGNAAKGIGSDLEGADKNQQGGNSEIGDNVIGGSGAEKEKEEKEKGEECVIDVSILNRIFSGYGPL